MGILLALAGLLMQALLYLAAICQVQLGSDELGVHWTDFTVWLGTCWFCGGAATAGHAFAASCSANGSVNAAGSQMCTLGHGQHDLAVTVN